MRPDQLGDYQVPSDPRLHPDGARIAFVLTRMNLAEDRYERSIWLWDGGAARRLTHGIGDSSPRWSPDGARLCFLRKGPDEKDMAQVAVMAADGGEAATVTEFELGAREVEWSPDGTRLGVVATVWTDEWRDLDDAERARRPRRIDRLPYRADNRGWTHDRRSHVFVLEPDGANVVCLTPGDHDEGSIVWAPDGAELAFLSSRHDGREHDPGTQLWRVPVSGGDPRAATPVGVWSHPSYDRDGRLHVIGRPDPWAIPDVMPLNRIEADGATPITSDVDRNFVVFSPPLAPSGPQWLADGSALTTLEDRGRISVARLAADGSVTMVSEANRVVTGISPLEDGGGFAFTATSPTDPGELWWWSEGEERRLTSFNDDFRGSTPLVAPSRFAYRADDGTEIEGWVYVPDDADRVPVLLNIHGGPATQYGYGFFDEFQVYAAAGYGVVAINPRGSSGYGSAHVRAVVDRWTDEVPPDFEDLRRAIPEALTHEPRLDGARRGVMGGSYGGLATIRLLSMEQDFRSAVAERGLYVWNSFAGTSDIGSWFEYTYLRARLPRDWERLWRASPLAQADSVRTPTLIIHSESDHRTPIEQAEQLFVALRRNGVETELVRFPVGEGHEMSRSGKPRHRLERFELVLGWHAGHLV